MTNEQTTVELSALLRRFAARYRAALLTRAGILLALGAALVAALAWKLPAWRVPVNWATGAPAALGAVLLAAVAWWVRRRWIADRDAAGYLDRALGLRERLVTAAEFAAQPEPPALLPLLVEDASRHYAAGTTNFPKPVDRTTGLLLAALLLLLVIPRVGITPPPAGHPPAEPGQQPPDPATPPPAPDQPSQDQAGGGGANAPQPSGAGQQGAEGQPQSTPPQSGADPSSGSSSQAGQQGADAGKGTASPQQGGGGPENAADRANTPASTGNAQSSEPKGQRQGDSAQPQSPGQLSGAAQSGRREETGGQSQPAGAGSQRGQHSPGREQQDGRQAAAAGKPGRGAAKDAEQAGSQGRGQQLSASAAQNMTRAEIQQLLKEVSGELRQLQAQLDAEGMPTRPQAGTSTDADLHGARETPEEGQRGMPVQLKTDTAETKSSRPGSGVGAAAQQASNAAPQARAEDASLADQPLDEPASARQAVPPEYRDVFNQLQRESTSTNQPRP